jgi:hypothetical protein
MRTVALLLVLLIGSSVPTSGKCASARCTCVDSPRNTSDYVRGQLASATAVFLGSVVRVTFDTTRGTFAELRVSRWWKGGNDSTVSLFLRAGRTVGTSCDLWLREGEEWLIFATARDGGMIASSTCTASLPRARGDSSLAVLGPGTEPRARGLTGVGADKRGQFR